MHYLTTVDYWWKWQFEVVVKLQINKLKCFSDVIGQEFLSTGLGFIAPGIEAIIALNLAFNIVVSIEWGLVLTISLRTALSSSNVLSIAMSNTRNVSIHLELSSLSSKCYTPSGNYYSTV